MMNLKTRMGLTYSLFIAIVLLALTIIINKSVYNMFSNLVKNNIEKNSAQIAQTMSGFYNEKLNQFDTAAIESIGMNFAHNGYLTTVFDKDNNIVWDARSCDVQDCNMIINSIADRMNEYKTDTDLIKKSYPLQSLQKTIGKVEIETYGTLFYSEAEAKFISSLNHFFIIAGIIFILLCIVISILLAAQIVKPIRQASKAARQIAGGNLEVRVNADNKTAELKELSASINAMAAELSQSEKRQKRLISDISHELRTPLTCLQGNLEAMIDGIWEASQDRLNNCYEEVKRLTKLIEDLNVLTDFEWEKISLNKTNFDISKLLAAAIDIFTPSANEKKIEIVNNCQSIIISADYDRLKQVFVNLISNAVKYTDSGSIEISAIQIKEPDGNMACEISVADTGKGISPDDMRHIFERFYRCDKSRNRNSGGEGLGLSIAAAIVKAHKGKITASHRDNGGSIFKVIIPMEKQ
ncbi:MAG: HAMP domain-containing protein [Endomicrobium sp.]|jgi:signal transduction histidine kinase|nr:HAMP domain-containing protein [Endomicrobium sp.]